MNTPSVFIAIISKLVQNLMGELSYKEYNHFIILCFVVRLWHATRDRSYNVTYMRRGCGGCFPCDTGISQVGGSALPMGPHPSTTFVCIHTHIYVCILSSPCQIAGKWCTFNNVPCHVHWFIEIKMLQQW